MKKHFSTSIYIVKEIDGVWKILLLFHKKFERWMVPGGHLEINESPIECAIREVKEETGLNINLFSFIHKEIEKTDSKWVLPAEYFSEQCIPSSKSDEEHIHLDFVYFGFCKNTDLIDSITHENHHIEWINIEPTSISNLNLFKSTAEIIKILHFNLTSSKPITYAQYIY